MRLNEIEVEPTEKSRVTRSQVKKFEQVNNPVFLGLAISRFFKLPQISGNHLRYSSKNKTAYQL